MKKNQKIQKLLTRLQKGIQTKAKRIDRSTKSKKGEVIYMTEDKKTEESKEEEKKEIKRFPKHKFEAPVNKPRKTID